MKQESFSLYSHTADLGIAAVFRLYHCGQLSDRHNHCEERGVFQGSDHAWYLRSDAGSPDKTDC